MSFFHLHDDPFPSNFDFGFYLKSLHLVFDNCEHAISLTRVFWHLYKILDLLPKDMKELILTELFLKSALNFQKFFFHWSFNLRSIYYHLLLYVVQDEPGKIEKLKFKKEFSKSSEVSSLKNSLLSRSVSVVSVSRMYMQRIDEIEMLRSCI